MLGSEVVSEIERAFDILGNNDEAVVTEGLGDQGRSLECFEMGFDALKDPLYFIRICRD